MFRVVRARDAEKGPFTELASGHLTRDEALTLEIRPREGEEKDLFFHSSELNGVMFDELREGDAVTFEVTNGDKGPAATNVSRA